MQYKTPNARAELLDIIFIMNNTEFIAGTGFDTKVE